MIIIIITSLFKVYQVPYALLTTLRQSFVNFNVYVKIRIVMGAGHVGADVVFLANFPAMPMLLVRVLSFEL